MLLCFVNLWYQIAGYHAVKDRLLINFDSMTCSEYYTRGESCIILNLLHLLSFDYWSSKF